MALTPSTMPPLGTPTPDFQLPDGDSRVISLHDFDGALALLVVFMSHHCPYTTHILPNFIEMARKYKSRGLATVVINSNDPHQHTEDRPENMAAYARQMGFPFPYLYDESQKVAKAYQAACTPDFFLYNLGRHLVYRGRYDDSRPDNEIPTTGDQLRAAIDAVLEEQQPSKTQKPSVGCNIKWKPGNEPEYFKQPEAAHA
jgi:peroxiredoxin